MADGETLRAYMRANQINKTKLATDLRITRQGLYVLFKSKEMEPETKKAIEKALKVKWSDLEKFKDDNIDDNVSIDMTTMTMKPTFGEKEKQPVIVVPSIQELFLMIVRLEDRIKNLQESIEKINAR